MVTVFKFLGREEIDNVATCINYRVDRMVYFGFNDEVMRQKDMLRHFLQDYCGVSSVAFITFSQNSLNSIIRRMREAIEKEKENGADFYFDITGGESLILIAFGRLSLEYETPMHSIDVKTGQTMEIDEGVDRSISEVVEANSFRMDIDRWIELKGGAINYTMHKEHKSVDDPDFMADVESLWRFMRRYPTYWNAFSEFIRNHMMPKNGLRLSVGSGELNRMLQVNKAKLNTVKLFKDMLDELSALGLVEDLDYSEGSCSYKYKNKHVLDCLTDGGTVLELQVFLREKALADDCRVGVHLDWDGVIHEEWGVDVLNEVDVLTLHGNVPTFISCKSGRMNSTQTLHALYELDTVAERFGGKYARKKLVTILPLPEVYADRAEEMGIELESQ